MLGLCLAIGILEGSCEDIGIVEPNLGGRGIKNLEMGTISFLYANNSLHQGLYDGLGPTHSYGGKCYGLKLYILTLDYV